MKPRKKNPMFCVLGNKGTSMGEQSQFRTLARRWFLWLGLHQNSQRWGDLGDVYEWSGVDDSFGSVGFNSGIWSMCLLHARHCGQSLSVPALLDPMFRSGMQTDIPSTEVWWQREVAASFSARPGDLKSQESVQVPNSLTSSSLILDQLFNIFKALVFSVVIWGNDIFLVHVMGCYEDLMRSFVWKPFWTCKEKCKLSLGSPRIQF